MAGDNSAPAASSSSSSASGAGVNSNDDFYKLNFKTLSGQDYPFEQLRGKVVLIANVASKCGFTPQYKGLEALNKKYAEKGLVVLGFPTNQFGHQEPGSSEEIQEFCQKNYGVTFTIMEKSDVNGEKENEVFKFIKAARPGLLGMKRIKWNFEKFLIDRHGNVVNRWSSVTAPKDIEEDIEKTLSQGQ
ncbi:glutathione peroxidase [Coemansia reversa NRRL 1564]|uniref:Glutathione peroxidase n=1 Tax=Coemansia reversa (strain ATCC 12441 / NRRL 1564) TaxID=763665 RepID=A0A2G5BDH7_COERN|nr:glutathione peroxidase [Coemansia reversa NRRL 1564]|eukprot:PIA17069.1 glutathione peroxidase [Coemansia reversa NRRL 1564]